MDDVKKISTKKLLEGFKKNLENAKDHKQRQDHLIAKWKDEYNGMPYGNEQKGKSRIISRDIKKQSEWQHASIVEPFVSTSDVIKCLPVTFEDSEAAKQNELLLNTQFCRKFPRFKFMSTATKVLDQEGTLVVQTGWETENKKVKKVANVVVVDENGEEKLVEQEIEEIVTTKNQPTAHICKNQDVFIDPTCQDNFDNAQFVIYRYETNLSSLRKDGRFKNLNKIAALDDKNDDVFKENDNIDFEFGRFG